MGPQLYRCGNQEREPHPGQRDTASMGPQLYRCGNSDTTDMEITAVTKLQWGRNFIVAETQYREYNNHYRNICFNGAATLSLRKLVVDIESHAESQQLQWGRNFIVAETYHIFQYTPSSHPLQWGRNFIVAETTCTIIIYNTMCTLQWGRNFIVAETYATHPAAKHPTPLQWGRNFIVAETEPRPHLPLNLHYASMGPQLYRCGNW